MNTPYEYNELIQVLIGQIEDAINYTAAGNMPHISTQIVNTTYNLLFDMGVFPNECKEWKKQPASEQTWDNLKAAFIQAYQDLQESTATTRLTSYANNIIEKETEVLEGMIHLVKASTEDRNTIAKLTEQNNLLQQEVRHLQSKLAEILKHLAKITNDSNDNAEKKHKRKKILLLDM